MSVDKLVGDMHRLLDFITVDPENNSFYKQLYKLALQTPPLLSERGLDFPWWPPRIHVYGRLLSDFLIDTNWFPYNGQNFFITDLKNECTYGMDGAWDSATFFAVYVPCADIEAFEPVVERDIPFFG